MKKILSLVLALLMSASAASFVGASEEAAIAAEDTVTAVAETTAAISEAEAEARAQYADALALLDAWKVLQGKEENNPAAADPIKRYEMALLVSRISTGWTDDSKWVADQWYDRDHDTSGFDDLEGSGAINVYGALSYASQKGIILGYGNRKFGPEDGITYQDALTMAVRTLGYFNLAWPWGNIEKAVTLGLTVGIPKSVKYTDTLNRGQVAQIIYNALFATTKDGDTLAARNFNGDLEWKSIIITVAGKKGYFFTTEDKDLNIPGAKLLDNEQKLGFKVVDKNGTLSEKTYWVKTNQIPGLGFTDRLENYLGFAYKALFSCDAGEYVTMEWLKPVQEEIVVNEGKLAVKGEFPIYDYLKGLNLRSKFEFSTNTYLNEWNGNNGWKEIIVMNALQGGSDILKAVGNKYGVDWSAAGKGNIVERVEKADDADYTVKIGDKEAYFKIAWRWNDTINAYFKYVYKDAAEGKTELVGIDILDQADIDKMMADLTYYEKDGTTKRGLAQITEGDYSKWAKTAYASLIPFTLNDAATPNYGIFEEYRLGQFTDAKIKCPNDSNAEKDGFKIFALNAVSDMAVNLFKKAAVNGGDLNADDFNGLYNQSWGKTVKYSGIYEGACDHGFYWINDKYGLDKPANDSYVIYSVDEGTGEIKIVKVIYDVNNEKHDATNFVATGVVRAYNIEKRTVTIGNTPYDWDYNCLKDCGLVLTDPSKKELRAEFTYLFKTLFNQYVNYVVCDGKLVYIELAGKSSELIVVDSYAGLSSDGYIVVNGWDTKNLVYRQFKIGSYNGWVKGDYYYYPGQAEVDAAFERGTLYKINSSDISDTDEIYYVSTIALAEVFDDERDYMTARDIYMSGYYDLDELVEKGITGDKETTVLLEAGYRKIAKTEDIDKTDWEKAKADQKYVLICNPIGNYQGNNWGVDDAPAYNWHDLDGVATNDYYYGDYAPIIVYKGTGTSSPKQWKATGWKVNGTDATVLVNVPFDTIVGFNKDQYDISYVLFLTYDYETATYDAYGHNKAWYLLGASEFTAQCFNFYSGKVEAYTAVNKNLKRGYAYPAMNYQIVSDEYVYGVGEVNGAITAAYTSGSHYVYGHDVMKNFNTYVNSDGKTVTGLLWNADQVSLKLLSKHPVMKAQTPDGSGVKGLTDSTAVFLIETEKELDYRPDGTKHVKFKNVENISKEEFDKWAEKFDLSELSFWYVHDRLAKRTVFYIEKKGVELGEIDPLEIDTTKVLNVSNDTPDYAYISSTLVGTGTTKEKNDKDHLTGADFDSVRIAFVGQATKDTHDAIDTNDYHFGRVGECKKEDWETKITFDGKTYRYVGSIAYKTYTEHGDDLAGCSLIQSIIVPLDGEYVEVKPDPEDPAKEIITHVNLKDLLLSVPEFDDTNALVKEVKFTVSFQDSNGTVYTFNYVVTIAQKADGYYTITFDYDTTNTIDISAAKDYNTDDSSEFKEKKAVVLALNAAEPIIARNKMVN